MPAQGLGSSTARYRALNRRRLAFLLLLAVILAGAAVHAIIVGSYGMGIGDVFDAITGSGEGAANVVVWNIRLPRIVAAIVCGWGLAVTGLVLQSLLKNPLASPLTLGISHGAAFGAAVSIVILGALQPVATGSRTAQAASLMAEHLHSVTFAAFVGAMTVTIIILMLARLKRLSPEAVILAGVALNALSVSGTFLIQYFASELEVAMVLFWTFGDVARSSWLEIGITAAATVLVTTYFAFNRWNLNAMCTSDECARGLGTPVERLRFVGMFLATVLIAFITAYHGIINFLGLLTPHIARRVAGADHGLLLPFSCVIGAILLLVSDTVGRLAVGSSAMPVGVVTSFMGAPLFLYLLIRGKSR